MQLLFHAVIETKEETTQGSLDSLVLMKESKTEEKRKKKAITLSARYLCIVVCSLSPYNTSELG
jgi:hypothetical protein